MLLAEIVTLLGCTDLLALDGAGGREIGGCFAADLMSEVLAFCGHGPLLVTVRGTLVALGRGEAQQIFVQRLSK